MSCLDVINRRGYDGDLGDELMQMSVYVVSRSPAASHPLVTPSCLHRYSINWKKKETDHLQVAKN